jgi:hypothetical protein
MPDLLDIPMQWTDVVKHLAAKDSLPTDLSSAELRQLPAALRRQSLYSARTLLDYHLDNIRDVVGSITQPQTIQRPDRVTDDNPQGNVTVGANPATARAALKKGLGDHGYIPAPEDKGTIKDLSSDARVNLVVRTNVQLCQGAGQFIQGNTEDAADLYPAWELIRIEDRETPRGEKREKGALVPDPQNGWPARFGAAAGESGDTDAARVLEETGRMMARKDSPLWQSLGDGAGGHEDTLGNPYPPFAFQTGMWTEEVSREEAVEAGLIEENTKVGPADFDIESLFGKNK